MKLETEPRSSRKNLSNVKYLLTQIKFERNAGREGNCLCFLHLFQVSGLSHSGESIVVITREKSNICISFNLKLKTKFKQNMKRRSFYSYGMHLQQISMLYISCPFDEENFFNVGSNILETNQWKNQVKCLSSKPTVSGLSD